MLPEGDVSGGDKSKKGVKRKKISEESGETAKRRSARVRNTKCKKEEKVDFQELLLKFLPSRYHGRRGGGHLPGGGFCACAAGLRAACCVPGWVRVGEP